MVAAVTKLLEKSDQKIFMEINNIIISFTIAQFASLYSVSQQSWPCSYRVQPFSIQS